jgi:hypothetical protein
MAWNTFFENGDRWRADPGLTRELAALLPETTDNVEIP